MLLSNLLQAGLAASLELLNSCVICSLGISLPYHSGEYFCPALDNLFTCSHVFLILSVCPYFCRDYPPVTSEYGCI